MYSFIQLSELEQCIVIKLAQGFNTAAQDSNPGPRSRESEALTRSHCVLQNVDIPASLKSFPAWEHITKGQVSQVNTAILCLQGWEGRDNATLRAGRCPEQTFFKILKI